MSASTNENVLELVKTLKNNYEDIVQYWKYRYTNAILEGFNSKIQSAKSQARGYKCFEWFRTIIYLLTAKLNWSNIFPHNPYENNILST
jgi:transposase